VYLGIISSIISITRQKTSTTYYVLILGVIIIYQFVGFLKKSAHDVVLGLAEEGFDVPVVGLQDTVEEL
jgi:hypothetical protein